MTQELTDKVFQNEVLDSAAPVLVDFWSPGCGPGKLQATAGLEALKPQR